MSQSHLSRLIFVTHEFPPRQGGIATYVQHSAAAAAGLGLECEVWSAEAASGEPGPYRLETIGNKGSLNWPCLWRTSRFMRARREAVENSTLCFAEPGPIFTYFYSPLLRLPQPRRLVLVLHGSEILRVAKFPHRRSGFRRLLKQADTIGVVSEFTARLLEEHFPGHRERVVLVPGALRSDFEKPSARNRPADDLEMRVLTVARLHPRKGLHHTIAALGRLPAELKHRVLYQAVGPASRPNYVRELKELAKRVGVRFEVDHDDQQLRQHYADADIFTMTSENSPISVESFGLVYLEAAASGLPVIAHDTGGVGEAVWHGKSGLLVKAGDMDNLTAAFEKLLRDPALRRELAAGGKRRVTELSWAANVKKLFQPELAAHADPLCFQ